MPEARIPWDLERPDTPEVIDRIRHGAFVNEGFFVAFPAAFPGVTLPPPHEESRVTALDLAADGSVYAGTGGRKAHLLAGMFRADSGMVFDMGTVDGAEECVAVCCGRSRVAAFCNGPDGGVAVAHGLLPRPFSLIQEWDVARSPFVRLPGAVRGERFVHAVASRDRRVAIVATEGELFTLDMDSGETRAAGAIGGRGRLTLDGQGRALGRDDGDTLWRFDPVERRLTRRAVELPGGCWDAPLVWSRHDGEGRTRVADAAGRIFVLGEDGAFAPKPCPAPLAPVTAMAETLDGRLYGFCGEGIARMFRMDPGGARVEDLGVAVSVLQRRRYGYAFADAVVGRDGEIIFAENDNGGHVWLYLPPVWRQARERMAC